MANGVGRKGGRLEIPPLCPTGPLPKKYLPLPLCNSMTPDGLKDRWTDKTCPQLRSEFILSSEILSSVTDLDNCFKNKFDFNIASGR